jgi:hypothetical protein
LQDVRSIVAYVNVALSGGIGRLLRSFTRHGCFGVGYVGVERVAVGIDAVRHVDVSGKLFDGERGSADISIRASG